MGVLQRFENRLEDVVGGAFARLFKGPVEPAEIVKALQREADTQRKVVSSDRILVPNRYVVEVSPADDERFAPWDVQLTRVLAEMVQEFIDDEGWSAYGDVEVRFELDERLRTGVFRVRSEVDADVPPRRRPHDSLSLPPIRDEPRPDPEHAARVTPTLIVDGTKRRFPLGGADIVIGRSQDADLRLADTGVSRTHAVVRYAADVATIEDLGSTNGTVVNGQRVDRVRLLHGDVIRLGHSVLVFDESDDQPVHDARYGTDDGTNGATGDRSYPADDRWRGR